ncbi:MAG: VWA domain-containing protein, partial [Syntrophorhabdales bacterium]
RPFSAVRLLLQSRNVVARPRRLKHLLLLALRVAAVTALVLMAARPSLVRPGLLAFGSVGSKAVIIDNSMSMGYTDADGERFARAKKAASAIIARLAGQVLVIPTVDASGGPEAQSRWMGPAEAARELAALSLTSGRGNPQVALALACRALQTQKGRKEIVVISDMAQGDWQGFDPAKLGVLPAEGRLSFLRIGGSARDSNMAVKGVSASPGAAFVGSPIPLTVTVSNLSDRKGPVLVQLLIDGVKVDQKTIEPDARTDAAVVFEVVCSRSGWRNGEAHLSHDNLPADDIFYFPLFVREKIRIAVVDGDPRGTMRESESYYLVRALRPDDSGQSIFQVQVFYEREFSEADLSGYDALFLLNVRKPPAARLAAFLDAGKSVFLFLGDRVLADEYNSIPLFPWRLRQAKEGEERPEKISRLDYSHPAIAPFREIGGGDLYGALFRRYYRIEGGAKPLLALANGDPLLLESTAGRGKLFLYASSADIDWNDLPLTPAYVPMMQGLTKTAVGTSEPAIPPDIKVGQAFAEKGVPEQVTGQPARTGIYRFSATGKEVRRAVNVPFEESDLTKMTEGALRRLFPGVPLTVTEYREDAATTIYGGRRDLWPYLLGFTLIVLAAEMGVAHKT